jgi:hypothetical protein
MKMLIDSLEREGGHILMLWIVVLHALLIMSLTNDERVMSICHDIIIGGFSALLALLKGNKTQLAEPK